ncbi:MAG: tyrosine decarboxylase/aspartate 1-decarboxylase [Planctomycetota bacterium]|jgi:tyrosine decarboxylase/aspartate 1-decarboxylase
MDARSRSISSVLAELETLRQGDFSYDQEGILGSMISGPHPLAVEVYARSLASNVGDPGLFPGVAQIEREVVEMLAQLLSNESVCGNLVSGGSEANILALWSAREAYSGKGIPQVIVPLSAHVSYGKAARLLGLELVPVAIDDFHRLDVDAVGGAIGSRTFAIVGVAGSTDIGAVDEIPALGQLALEHGLHLHVDAAFGGFVLPFLKELGRPAPAFDFAVPGVASMTIDPHKMGLGVQPAGAVLFRDRGLSQKVRTDIDYLAGGKTHQDTLTGTRPGAAACATWAVMKHLGREGYRGVVEECMQRTDSFLERLAEVPGIVSVTPPEMNIVGLRPENMDVGELANRLRARGWALGSFTTHLRAVLLPHISEAHLDLFFPQLMDVLAVSSFSEVSRT